MKRVAFDLRCLPNDGSVGGGIPHAARDLWLACHAYAREYGLECVAFVRKGASLSPIGKIIELDRGNSFELRRELARQDCQAFFAANGTLPLGITLPAFLWVHDVAIFDHPDWFAESWLQRQWTTRVFLRGVKRANQVFCVSEDTRRAVECLARISPQALSVTYEGVECLDTFQPESARSNYALILGTVEPRKNIPFLVELWPELCRILGRSVELVIAGQDGWGNVRILEGDGIRRISQLTDQERDGLIRNARMVLVPSLHEGFGRVVLEAMASGTPVVASCVGGHPEVVGEAGLLLSPQDSRAWKEAVIRLFTDSILWSEYAERGYKRAQIFSWESVARHILAGIVENC